MLRLRVWLDYHKLCVLARKSGNLKTVNVYPKKDVPSKNLRGVLWID